MQWENNVEPAVLFVCLGNICRSPMAEGALRAAAAKAGLTIRIDSAGTASYHIGDPPDPRAIETARQNGVDISSARGRQLTAKDFEEFTHIFALDTANLAGIAARAPHHSRAQIALLLDCVEGQEGGSVPDPYYGDKADFEVCWNTVQAAVEKLALSFVKEGSDRRGEGQPAI